MIFKENDKVNKVIKIGLLLLLLLFVVSMVKSLLIEPITGSVPDFKTAVYNIEWEKSAEGNGNDSGPAYVCTIPEGGYENGVLCIKNYWSTMRVYLDDKEVYVHEDPYLEKGASRHWIRLFGDIGGKQLTVKFPKDTDMVQRTIKSDTYFGEANPVFVKLFRENIYAVIFAAFAFAISAAMLCCALAFKRRIGKNTFFGIVQLAVFVLLTGIWIVTDSQLLFFVSGRTAFISLVSFLSFMIMPVSLLAFINVIMIHKKKIFDILSGLFLLQILVCMSLYLLRLVPLYKTIAVHHILLAVTIFAMLREGIWEIRNYKNHEMGSIIVGLGLLSAFGIVSMVLFYVAASPAYAYFGCIGIILFLVCMTNAAFRISFYHLGRSANIATYRHLAYVDSMTGLGNRTAYVEEQGKGNSTKKLAYIMFDINNLKAVNDQYGHQEGDRLIIDTAGCINSIFGRIGKCFRIGGDEFLAILEGVSKEDIKMLLAQFEERVNNVNSSRLIPTEVAFGFALQKTETTTGKELFEKADEKMYQKKQRMKKEKKALEDGHIAP